MSRTIADEREHRRGLVLGLTLAELLLLLLFLLLLVLGARLQRTEELKVDAEVRAAELEQVKLLWTKIQESDNLDLEINVLIKRLSQLTTLEAETAALRSENATLREALLLEGDVGGQLETLRSAMTAAGRIDPKAPPAVLKRAVEVLNRLGPDVQPDQVRPLSEMLAAEERLREIEQAQAEMEARAGTEAQSNEAGHLWPPIISLSEANGYFFARGHAELTPSFEQQLSVGVVPKLLKIAGEYQVDVIEVVGHTDEQPIAPRPSNLDKGLIDVLLQRQPVSALSPADNAGLGLSRAAAVVRALSADPRLKSLRILPLSAAQLIMTDGTLSDGTATGDVRERRRIEIRMRRSN